MPKPPPSDKVGKRPSQPTGPKAPARQPSAPPAGPIEQARAKQAEGDLLGAAAILEEACAQAGEAPSDPKQASRLELALGRLYFADGRIDLAVDRYQRAYKLDPDHVEAIEAGREVHATLGDFATVARLYEVELELVPVDDGTRARRARLKAELGRVKARRLGDAGGAVALLEEALKLANTGETEGAARSLADGIRESLAELYLSPETPAPGGDGAEASERAAELFVELARRAAARKDVDAELRALKRALGADPYHPEAAARLEAAIQASGDEAELLRLYRGGAEVPDRARKLALAEARALRALGPAASAKAQAAIDAVLDGARAGYDVSDAAELVRAALRPGGTPAAGTTSPTGSGTFPIATGGSPEKTAAARLAAFDEQLLEAELSSELLHPSAYTDALVEVAARWRDAGEPGREEAALDNAYRADPTSPTAFAALVELKAARRDHAGLLLLLATIDEAPQPEQPARLALLADALDKRLGDSAAALDAWRRSRGDRAGAEGRSGDPAPRAEARSLGVGDRVARARAGRGARRSGARRRPQAAGAGRARAARLRPRGPAPRGGAGDPPRGAAAPPRARRSARRLGAARARGGGAAQAAQGLEGEGRAPQPVAAAGGAGRRPAARRRRRRGGLRRDPVDPARRSRRAPAAGDGLSARGRGARGRAPGGARAPRAGGGDAGRAAPGAGGGRGAPREARRSRVGGRSARQGAQDRQGRSGGPRGAGARTRRARAGRRRRDALRAPAGAAGEGGRGRGGDAARRHAPLRAGRRRTAA